MNVTQAMERLEKAWPGVSFSIDLEIWSHVHGETRNEPQIKWSVYRADEKISWSAHSLAGAVGLALGDPLTSLTDVDEATEAL